MQIQSLFIGTAAIGATALLVFVSSPAWKVRIFHLLVLPSMSIGAIASMTNEYFVYFVAFHVFQFSGMAVCLHRYFSHRSFATSRWFQFILGIWGALAIQGGCLFWASEHRHHHRECDRPGIDPHTPYPAFTLGNVWRSHLGWFHRDTTWSRSHYDLVPDLLRFPELRIFESSILAITAWFGFGYLILGWQGVLLCGLSTFTSNHAGGLVNSVCHMFGEKRLTMPTVLERCRAGNVWWTFPLQLGENWHRNHHRYGSSATTRLAWYQLDPIFWLIRTCQVAGLVWNVIVPDAHRRARHTHPRSEEAALGSR